MSFPFLSPFFSPLILIFLCLSSLFSLPLAQRFFHLTVLSSLPSLGGDGNGEGGNTATTTKTTATITTFMKPPFQPQPTVITKLTNKQKKNQTTTIANIPPSPPPPQPPNPQKKKKKIKHQTTTMRRQHQDQQSKVFHELSTLVLNILRSSPTSISFSNESLAPMTTTRSATTLVSRRSSTEVVVAQITSKGFAYLMLGISLALMLCGLLTLFIGFLLMP